MKELKIIKNIALGLIGLYILPIVYWFLKAIIIDFTGNEYVIPGVPLNKWHEIFEYDATLFIKIFSIPASILAVLFIVLTIIIRKKEQKSLKTPILFIGLFIGILGGFIYFLDYSENHGEHFISGKEYYYDKSIEYFNKYYTQNYGGNYSNEKVFKEYEEIGISKKDEFYYVYMFICSNSYYEKNNKIYPVRDSINDGTCRFTIKNEEIVDANIFSPSSYIVDSFTPKKIKNKENSIDIYSLRYKLEKKVKNYYANLEMNIKE